MTADKNPDVVQIDSTDDMENTLRKQLLAAEDLITELRADNDRLRKETTDLRKELVQSHENLRERHLATHQLSRVLRVFPVLGLEVPLLRGDVLSDGDLRAIPGRVRESLQIKNSANVPQIEAKRDHAPRSMHPSVIARREKAVTECLRLLIGAQRTIVEDDGRIRILLRDEERSRELEFWLNQAEDKMEYTKINVRLEDEICPDFALEDGIEFDVSQGVNFLAQILGAMYDLSIKPKQPESACTDDDNVPDAKEMSHD